MPSLVVVHGPEIADDVCLPGHPHWIWTDQVKRSRSFDQIVGRLERRVAFAYDEYALPAEV